MQEPRISVTDLMCIWWLSYHRFLSVPFCHHIPPHEISIRQKLYDCYRQWMVSTPDHVFNNSWQALGWQNKQHAHITMDALSQLSDNYLEVRHQKVFVQFDKFGAWQQGLLSRISFLPLMAVTYARQTQKIIIHHHRPHPHTRVLEDYLEREQLHEVHAHLNGSSFAEHVWLHALNNTFKATDEFSHRWIKNHTTQDFVRSINPELNPCKMRKHLITAKQLRMLLIYAAYNSEAWISSVILDPKDAPETALANKFNPDAELQWQTRFLAQCAKYPDHDLLIGYYHQYLLLFNQYYQLLVQGENQRGFDQFHKVSQSDLRDDAEKNYKQRFLDVHGQKPRRSQIGFYEGRFAPKEDVRKLEIRLLAILQGYQQYLGELICKTSDNLPERSCTYLNGVLKQIEELHTKSNHLGILPMQLILVCHFIKKEWTAKERQHAPYRHHAQVKSLHTSGLTLLSVLKRQPLLSQWINGIDAADNELKARPEFFAPIYRMCTQFGLTHKTIHAGEDFSHLLCGIAYMHDALLFLDLRDGDRIGHGTAMGIDPDLWIQRMPQQVLVKRGDWFLALLAMWQLVQKHPDRLYAVLHKIERDIQALSIELFHESLSPFECEQAMNLRGLSLPELHKFMKDPEKYSRMTLFNECIYAEIQKIQEHHRNNPSALARCWKWQSDRDLWTASEAFISVDSKYLSPQEYVLLQQILMREVNQRGVVIETLPSSNVRISHYRGFEQHHALRWMSTPKKSKENDPKVLLALGSDDPGIFANDLLSDFYHLFIALKNTGLDETESLNRVAEINARGRSHRFRPAGTI